MDISGSLRRIAKSVAPLSRSHPPLLRPPSRDNPLMTPAVVSAAAFVNLEVGRVCN